MNTVDNHDFQPLLDVQLAQFDVVMNEATDLDTKSLALLGVNATVLIFVKQTFPNEPLLLLPLIFSFLLDLYAIWPKAYMGAVVDLAKHPEYLHTDTSQLTLQLISDTREATEYNAKLNNRRWPVCLASILLTAAGVMWILL